MQNEEQHNHGPSNNINHPENLAVHRDTEADGQRKKPRVGMSIPSPNTENIQLVEPRTITQPQTPLSPLKSVLRKPKEVFPEDPNPVREGVAPLGLAREIPVNARWTKIDRELVDPEALEAGSERYEERPGYVIVLRVLTKEEIRLYAMKTQEIRDARVRDASHTSESGEHEQPTMKENMESGQYKAEVEVTNEKANSIAASESPDERQPTQSGYLTIDELTARVRDLGTAGDSPRMQSGLNLHHGGVPVQPKPARQRASSSKPRLLSDDQILTYDDEKLFNHSAGILKELKKCTEHCKDIIVTLLFCIDVQPDVDNSTLEIFEVSNACNTSLKGLLMTIDPVSNVKKIAEIVVADLDVLLHGLQASLKTIQNDFDHIDIVPMGPDQRRAKWQETLSKHEDKYACTLLANLTVVHRFQEEVTSNLKLGLYKSTESAMWKKRLARLNGYKDLPTPSLISPTENSANNQFMGQSYKRSIFLSPSGYVQSPNRSSARGSPPRQPRKKTQRRRESLRQDSPLTEDEDVSRDLVIRGGRKRESSSEDLSSSASTLTSGNSDVAGEMNWLWISQLDILPGYFATPWKSVFSISTCTAAISVLIKTIERFTNNSNLRYVSEFPDCKQWLRSGKITYPSYAHGANGGVVVTGIYEPAAFDAFETTLTPIKLLGSLDAQSNPIVRPTTTTIIDSLTELMNLDSWLSICGRAPEISTSPHHLLHTLTNLIQRIMQDFDLEFSSVDRAPKGGGGRIVRTISDSL
ncbi:MAG: hypothetical protein Q9196_007239, partial [Gyalolechia fulgens]